MPLMKSLATSLASRRMAQTVSRRIPNPLVRFAVVTAATTLAPYIARKVQAAWARRQLKRETMQRLAPERRPLSISR